MDEIKRNELGQFAEGNLAQQKYSNEDVVRLFKKMILYLEGNPKEYMIKGVLYEYGLNFPWLSRVLKRTGDGTEEIRPLYEQLNQLLEIRLVNNTLNGIAKSAAMAIFILKNKYGYEDKQNHDHTTQGAPMTVLKIGDREIKL